VSKESVSDGGEQSIAGDPGARVTHRDEEKRAAAETAVAMVEDGMVIGLGTGSTARYAIEALIRRVHGGLRVRAIPTSERSAAQARAGGIPLTTFAEHRRLDLTIDGADEIELGTLNLIKGLGGALLREKIVASVSARLVIVADHEKLVDRLGTKTPVPVEVVGFGWETTADRLRGLGANPHPRRDAEGRLFCTDGGNRILDCDFGAITDAENRDRMIGQTVGVIETGLFIGMADTALIADATGVRAVRRGG
jgi:ribose 5-phosphate isomerase A